MEQFKALAQKYLKEIQPNDEPPHRWKHFAMDFSDLAHSVWTEPEEEKIADAFFHFGGVVFCACCHECGDEKLFEWVALFCAALISEGELPDPPECCLAR